MFFHLPSFITLSPLLVNLRTFSVPIRVIIAYSYHNYVARKMPLPLSMYYYTISAYAPSYIQYHFFNGKGLSQNPYFAYNLLFFSSVVFTPSVSVYRGFLLSHVSFLLLAFSIHICIEFSQKISVFFKKLSSLSRDKGIRTPSVHNNKRINLFRSRD
jgi:hypothetical protein